MVQIDRKPFTVKLSSKLIEAPCSPPSPDGEQARPVESRLWRVRVAEFYRTSPVKFPQGNPIKQGELEHFYPSLTLCACMDLFYLANKVK
jgi:hypothetical protein